VNLFRREKIQAKPEIAATATALPYASGSVFNPPALRSFYDPVMLNPSTVAAVATQAECVQQVLDIVRRLEPDDYIRYLVAYCERGLELYGKAWRYADITTVLLATAQLSRPDNYLEIGVRRGRSMAVMGWARPTCAMVGFDIWQPNYADMDNPGPEFVRAELRKIGHSGPLELVSGNSHETVPTYLAQHPNLFFDVITVDGDHSEAGAEQDLRDVLPRLTVGGIIILDDICSPIHPYLGAVWRRVVANDARYMCWEFTELGYGIAFAMRRQA
jgi:predicted O-methyltransferase YrrM